LRTDQLTGSLLMIVISLACSLGGQLVLKAGASSTGSFAPVGAGPITVLLASARSPLIWIGLILSGASAFTWIIVLTKVDLSLAYPLGAINYALAVVLSRFILAEPVPPLRWLAILVICTGIVMLARSSR
jgi:multidrug transporter EmrE-like cation transporter